jgi:HAE1 family hydrophobic/amphiphilic exporter-1
MMLTVKGNRKVPLSAVATFRDTSAPVEIRRDTKQRIVRITANLAPGYSLSDVNQVINTRINKEIKFPAGYGLQRNANSQASQLGDLGKDMSLAMLLAVVFMYIILASLYNSFVQPLILLISVPLALIGAFLALLLTGTNLDVYGFIGLVLVLGLVAKNAILLIDFANKERKEGKSIRESLLSAGSVRLRPILMTTFALIFGMLPLAFGLNEGSKGREALPISVIGGLITSTFLTVLIVPIVYETVEGRLENFNSKRRGKREAKFAEAGLALTGEFDIPTEVDFTQTAEAEGLAKEKKLTSEKAGPPKPKKPRKNSDQDATEKPKAKKKKE